MMLRFVNARNDKKKLNEIKNYMMRHFQKKNRFPSGF